MAFLSDSDKARVRDAIFDMERQTAGELVTVIAQEADTYRFIPTLWAATASLLVPPVVLVAGIPWSLMLVSTVQLGVFAVLALLGRWRPVRYLVVPKNIKKARAARLARMQFFAQGVRETKNRSGVLIFVSVAERHVEILADTGISARVGNEVWQKAVDRFVAHIKAGEVADGFLAAIEECGKVLVEHFPRQGDEPDELPNHLIEI